MSKTLRRPAQTPLRVITELRTALARIDRGMTADRVQRKKAEALLTHLARIPVAVLVADSHARYIDVNVGATLLTGYSRRELLAMSVWDLTVDADVAAGRVLWQVFLEAGELAGAMTCAAKMDRSSTRRSLPRLMCCRVSTCRRSRAPACFGS